MLLGVVHVVDSNSGAKVFLLSSLGDGYARPLTQSLLTVTKGRWGCNGLLHSMAWGNPVFGNITGLNQTAKSGPPINSGLYGESWASQVALVVKNPPANAGDTGSIPGLGRSPRGGHGNPLQYSCLENPIYRGAWQATVHGVANSQTQLKPLSTCAWRELIWFSLASCTKGFHSLAHCFCKQQVFPPPSEEIYFVGKLELSIHPEGCSHVTLFYQMIPVSWSWACLKARRLEEVEKALEAGSVCGVVSDAHVQRCAPVPMAELPVILSFLCLSLPPFLFLFFIEM